MALENAAIAKIGGGLVAVGGVSGAGVYSYKAGLWDSIFNSGTTSLIVKATAAESGLTDNLFTSDVKNYQCKFISKTDNADPVADKNCEIVEIANDKFFDSATKKIKLDEIIKANNIHKAKIENSKYYKINIKTSLLSSIKINSASTIDVIKQDVSDIKSNTDKFGTLKTLFWIDKNNKAMSYVHSLLVTGVSAGISGKNSTKSSSKCSFGNVKTPYECEIWKYKTNQTPVLSGDNIDPKFNELEKNTSSEGNISAITVNSNYLIQFTTELPFDLNDSKINETITYTEWKSDKTEMETDKLVQTFKLSKKLIGEWTNNAVTALGIVE